MTQRRSRRSSSSSTATLDHDTTTTANTPFGQPAIRNPHTTDANLHSALDSTAASSPSSATATALVPEPAVFVNSQAFANAHVTQIPTTFKRAHSPSSSGNTPPRKHHCGPVAMSDEMSEERAPAQVVAQAAPTASDEADTLTDSSSTVQGDTIRTSSPAVVEPLCSNMVTASNSDGNSHSSVDSPGVGVTTHIETQDLVSSPPHSDDTMASQSQQNAPGEVQSQEGEHVDNINPAIPRSGQNHGDEMSTTLPATPPMNEEPQSASSSASSDWWTEWGVPPPLPKPDTAMLLPDQAVSFIDISESLAERNMQSNIFSKTRESIKYQGARVLIISSRGFQREHLPTKQTRPPLLKRRYSVDVNTTTDWERETDHWEFVLSQTYDIPELPSKEVDPLPALTHGLQLPHPARYTAFASAFDHQPPHNEGVFLELGDVTLHNDAFNYIGATNSQIYRQEVWMRDESLDMALEVLRRDYDCDADKIGIANSTVAQICYFARMSGEYSAEYEQYRSRYADKNWIFIVINDAIGGVENDGHSGSHWSLAVLDRISKTCYYFDSLYINLRFYQGLGQDMSMGMLHILGESPDDWRYRIQFNSPNQYDNNRFKEDGGACGPFVYKMSQMLINAIKLCQLAGREHNCDLTLKHWFPEQFESEFHSEQVRYEIKDKIARWARKQWSSRLVDNWDTALIQGTDAVLDDGPVVTFEVPGRSSRTHASGRNVPSGNSYQSPITLDEDDENYVVHGNRRDSFDSNVASAGGDTAVVDLGEDSDDTWVVSDDDMNLDEDDEETAEVVLDGQIQIDDYPVHGEEKDA
ncbi:hypothetical protein BKA58DRAFT_467808 [Alternaria rosae]|uniref:uncharacterized protein n=1 Tax=Alternaria rosae TaxID=1187941 RepID=UPI001E8CB4ED|nr:uncharacterized protein BKA58DRAFT_467808 [Alternaria rosae]KAH6876121.1 hypothetical protein BKA58DRAFT_467808 [Alternaria rosae]